MPEATPTNVGPVHLDRNAKFLHAHGDIFFQLIPPAVGEVLGVVSRVFAGRAHQGEGRSVSCRACGHDSRIGGLWQERIRPLCVPETLAAGAG